jgi:hypothetical protein
MPKLLPLAFLLLAPAALAQSGIVSAADTDQAEYAYGEAVELRYTISNESDDSVTLVASSGSCQVGFTFGTFSTPGESGGCTLDEVHLDFAPQSTRTWVWQIVPNEHGVPEVSGEQTITTYFDGAFGIEGSFPATATLTAPRYVGGRVILRLAEGVVVEDVQGVADTLNAEVIEEWDHTQTYLWEIEGTTLDDAIAAYGSDPRFQYMQVYRHIDFSNVLYTDDEDGAAPPSTPALTAAHPNPFAASTSFAVTVPESGPARVEVFDVLGRRVAVLHDGPLAAGPEHHFTFHAAGLPSGLYVVRASGEGFTSARRVTLSR